jgi:hypothetical protein
LVRNLTIMHCATSKGTTCSLIATTTDKKWADMQRYVITVIGIPSLTTSKVILFYAGISVLQKKVWFIFALPSYNKGVSYQGI